MFTTGPVTPQMMFIFSRLGFVMSFIVRSLLNIVGLSTHSCIPSHLITWDTLGGEKLSNDLGQSSLDVVLECPAIVRDSSIERHIPANMGISGVKVAVIAQVAKILKHGL